MWICFNNAFISAVQDERHPDLLKVRARSKVHLERLFPDRKKDIITSPNADYRWRIFVDKTEFAHMVAMKIMNLDYGNFKDSVEENDLHDMYALWWGDHFKFQDKIEHPRRYKKNKKGKIPAHLGGTHSEVQKALKFMEQKK